jgi:lysophospholipase L1-like esterase
MAAALAEYDCALSHIDGAIGRRTSGAVPLARQWASPSGAASRENLLLLVSGSNDCNAADFGARVEQILDAAGAQRVVWVATWHRCSAALNAQLSRIAAARPNLTVVDPATALAGAQRRDRVHLTGPGYQAFARNLARVVAARLSADQLGLA